MIDVHTFITLSLFEHITSDALILRDLPRFNRHTAGRWRNFVTINFHQISEHKTKEHDHPVCTCEAVQIHSSTCNCHQYKNWQMLQCSNRPRNLNQSMHINPKADHKPQTVDRFLRHEVKIKSSKIRYRCCNVPDQSTL